MNQALLVGINQYPYPNTLNGCIDDIIDVASELTSAFSVDPNSITQLRDGDATADAIRSTLSRLVNGLQDGDRFLFWYSGHGAQLQDGCAATDVICPIDFDWTAQHSVTVSDFHAIFKNIPPNAKAFWGSDSCHSGDLNKGLYRFGVPRLFRRDSSMVPAAPVPTSYQRMRDISTALPNIVLISGCRSDQTSADADIQGRYNGAFTYYFLQALREPKGTTMPMNELVPEVQKKLNSACYSQIPQMTPSGVARPFLQ
jgi:hypothetical protein